MRKTQHSHFAVCIETGEVRISIDPFLSENPSSGNGRSGYLTAKNSTQGGDR
jgi:L-ascorbate metabolism protein UlaG (beta-lactamase superfamily)